MIWKRCNIKGVGLLETVVSTSILSVILIGTMGILTTSQSAVQDGLVRSSLESQAQFLMERIITELRRADTSSLIVASDRMQFQIIQDFTLDGPQKSSDLITYQLLTSPTNQIIRKVGNNTIILADNITGAFTKTEMMGYWKIKVDLILTKTFVSQRFRQTITTQKQINTEVFIPTLKK